MFYLVSIYYTRLLSVWNSSRWLMIVLVLWGHCFSINWSSFFNKVLRRAIVWVSPLLIPIALFISYLISFFITLFPLGTILLFRIPWYTTLYVSWKHCKYLPVKHTNINMVIVMVMPFLFFFLNNFLLFAYQTIVTRKLKKSLVPFLLFLPGSVNVDGYLLALSLGLTSIIK